MTRGRRFVRSRRAASSHLWRRCVIRCARRRRPSGIWCSPNRIPAANTAPTWSCLPMNAPSSSPPIVAALLELAIATLAGLHIRSRALASLATAKADAADAQVAQLKTAIDSQQLADAIAAEAHDTLAHSLSLLALNASALQAESKTARGRSGKSWTPISWPNRPAGSRRKPRKFRKQAAGALWTRRTASSTCCAIRSRRSEQLAPSDETSLTRESLDALIGDARAAGMRLNTWIDIQQLGQLNRETGKIAYRVPSGGTDQREPPCAGIPGIVGTHRQSHRRRARACVQSDHSSQRYASRHECKRHVSDWRRIARTGGTRPPVRRNMPIRF